MRVQKLNEENIPILLKRAERKKKSKFLFFWKRYAVPNALPSERFPNDVEEEYTWEKWDKDMQKQYPVQHFLRKRFPEFFRYSIWFPVRRPFSAAWDWLRYRTWNRYHILNLSNEAFGYKVGYQDVDHKMIYACFNLLQDFVEKQRPFEYIVWEPADEAEIKELYGWWTGGRKAEWAACDQLWDAIEPLGKSSRAERRAIYEGEAYLSWRAELDRLEAKDGEMLLRLIKIRGMLWT